MTEFFTGLITGYVLTWYGTLAFILLGIFAERNESFWSVLCLAIVASIVYTMASPSITIGMLALGVIGYLILGLAWSFWRYRKFVNKQVIKINETFHRFYSNHNYPEYFDREVKQLHPSNQVNHIVAWILAWPFSLIESGIGDLIDFAKSLVTTVFRSVYAKIYDSAINS
jgi:hypothetical protein